MTQEGPHFNPLEDEKAIERNWWGVTVGSLTYAVRATTTEQAVNMTFAAIGVPREGNIVPSFVELHPDESQMVLNEKFGTEEGARRVIPFSIEEWPQTSGVQE